MYVIDDLSTYVRTSVAHMGYSITGEIARRIVADLRANEEFRETDDLEPWVLKWIEEHPEVEIPRDAVAA